MTEETLLEEWKGITIGMWADNVLEIHPKHEWIAPASVARDVKLSEERGYDCLVVTWHYNGADVMLEIADVNTLFGDISLYAVQKIVEVLEAPQRKKQRKRKK